MPVAATCEPEPAAAGRIPAENDEEVFDIFDREGNHLGTELRGVCHARGIIHRAVYCFVFNGAGQLLLQQRSAKKKIAPLKWDLSVAEHLQPGESFQAAAERGLREELGIDAPVTAGPLAPYHLRELVIPGVMHDAEFVEAYRLDGWEGPVAFNQEEVNSIKWVSLAALQADMLAFPDDYTEWLTAEIASLNWFSNEEHATTHTA